MSILANAINGILAAWFRPRQAASNKGAGGAIVIAMAPKKLSAGDQWARLSGVVCAAITSAANARDLQAGAAQQLDLATYALYNLFDELTSVMSEPLVREAAVVHRLQPKASRRSAAALAA